MAESKTQAKERAREVVSRLKREYPDSACSLNYSSRHELLVATILSAQCTDERVNKTTAALFEKYKSPQDFAYANPDELSQDIRSCGYHNQKARSIQGASLRISEDYRGNVPDSLSELVKLPGVGRKTANCVLGECFGKPAVVIDTHMVRLMNLLGFTTTRKPEKIERELMEIFDREDWVMLTHMIIDHGRAVCIARRPQCQNCVLSDLCPAASVY
ncbi:MAG: endonuclease III [Candidatus Marinimicrobia bacterium]|nr:endonuclease III [Candidatus Neomarinimicrobiota bacterium]